ncbi:MAG: hypothetical protein QMD00_06080, partial [Hadesarchaea archaeon]|nr:hypothetical protein [Hadesarchaea archaeon]
MPSSEDPGEKPLEEKPLIEVVPSIGEKKKTPGEIKEAKEIREKIERKKTLKEIEKEKWKEIRKKQKKGELLSQKEAAMIRERELAKRVKKEKRVEEEILEKPTEVKQEERPEEELEKELEERRKAYAEAYKQSREVLAKGKKEKELKELLEAYEPAIKPVREKHILTGDSEKLKQGDKEAEERRKNFIEELKTRGIKEERASAIYEAELKKAEYEAVKVEAGKKMAEAGVEKAEIFKKLILNEHDLLNQAKVETWPPKEKNCFRKAMAWWLKKPTKTRLLYSTLALTGGLAAAGAIGGIGMLAGASMATIAKFGGLRFIRALAGATVGQFVAGGIERTYGRKLARTKG